MNTQTNRHVTKGVRNKRLGTEHVEAPLSAHIRMLTKKRILLFVLAKSSSVRNLHQSFKIERIECRFFGCNSETVLLDPARTVIFYRLAQVYMSMWKNIKL